MLRGVLSASDAVVGKRLGVSFCHETTETDCETRTSSMCVYFVKIARYARGPLQETTVQELRMRNPPHFFYITKCKKNSGTCGKNKEEHYHIRCAGAGAWLQTIASRMDAEVSVVTIANGNKITYLACSCPTGEMFPFVSEPSSSPNFPTKKTK